MKASVISKNAFFFTVALSFVLKACQGHDHHGHHGHHHHSQDHSLDHSSDSGDEWYHPHKSGHHHHKGGHKNGAHRHSKGGSKSGRHSKSGSKGSKSGSKSGSKGGSKSGPKHGSKSGFSSTYTSNSLDGRRHFDFENDGSPFAMKGASYVDSACATMEDKIECPLPSDVEDGVFVCREFAGFLRYSREETVCIPTDKGIETDACGCCGGECPKVCACPCDLENGADGVLVATPDWSGLSSQEECVPPGMALRMLAHPKHQATCSNDCATVSKDSTSAEPTNGLLEASGLDVEVERKEKQLEEEINADEGWD